jgi:hypothetical protein
MFLLQDELPAAAVAFADKMADVRRRRRVLSGADPFAELVVPRKAEIARLQQVLLNLSLRLRAAYVLRGLREEQLALSVADAAGPLRACAAAVLELRGRPAASPKEALEALAPELGVAGFAAALAALSHAREEGALEPGQAGPALLALVALCEGLRARAAALGDEG